MWVREAVAPGRWRPVLRTVSFRQGDPPVDEAGRMQETIRRAAAGDRKALEEVLAAHREPLVRMVRVRLDRRLHGRVDASDVVQDAWMEISRRLEEYAREPKMPFLVWIRFLTSQR